MIGTNSNLMVYVMTNVMIKVLNELGKKPYIFVLTLIQIFCTSNHDFFWRQTILYCNTVKPLELNLSNSMYHFCTVPVMVLDKHFVLSKGYPKSVAIGLFNSQYKCLRNVCHHYEDTLCNI